MLRLQTYLPTAALAFLIFYFAFSGLTGEKGLLLSQRRAAMLARKQTQLRALRARGAELATEVRFLADDHLSADLLEERAHVLLGFTDPRDYVIRDVPKSG